MKKLILICLIALLTGCYSLLVKREYTNNSVRVYWIEIDKAEVLYSICGGKVLGCETISADRDTCVVYIFKNPSLESLGHAMLHCFTGDWHKN